MDFENMILPLIARLRNANVSYAPQMFWATNPKFDHGIYHWIKDFYLDRDGIPLASKSNIERYFVLKENKPIWFDNRADAEAIYGSGKDSPIRSFRSIRAHVTDNIPLLRAQPDYLSNLKAQTEIRQRIYLDGSWTAREEEAGYYKREWSKIVPFANLKANRRVRCWDLAATPPSTANPEPDWTRGVLVSKDETRVYTVEDIQSVRDRPHVVEQLIYDTAEMDGRSVTVVIPCDPGQAGTAYANTIKSKLAEKGFYCKIVKTNKSKLTRFLPFSSIAEAGGIHVVKAEWNEEFFKELENFNGERNNGFDDICDACADSIIVLNQTLSLPSMSLSDISLGTSRPSFDFNNTSQQVVSIPTFNISNI